MDSELPKVDGKIGLILSGGGARAAYQVGVLKGISNFLPRKSHNPFNIICGTSAGAINAAVIATRAEFFRAGILNMEHVWRNFSSNKIYRTDIYSILKCAYHWAGSFLGHSRKGDPIALFDNTPLKNLLNNVIPFPNIQSAIDDRFLDAISITASSYTTGESISFFQAGDGFEGWRRVRRVGKQVMLTLDHLLASSAIPVFFPSINIDGHYFGDGAVRQLAPMSPALHLGANKIMVIGVSANLSEDFPEILDDGYPSFAQIGGHLLNSAFLDSFEGDIERLERVNKTVSLIEPDELKEKNLNLRRVDLLLISPSKPLNEIAVRHISDLSKTMRFFMGRVGATETKGVSILSYLLFERGFCRELIKLGYGDALKQKDAILQFFGY